MFNAQVARKAKRLVPLIVIGGIAYVTYSSCYVIAYQEYYLRHRRAAAVVLWVLMGLLQVSLFFYWIVIFRLGCGSYPEFQTFDLYGCNEPDSSPVPFAFLSDEQGYPFWCTKCQNLKPNRTFHSMDMDRCVPKFDHFCMWIGTAIGRDNYVAFVKFLQLFGSYLITVLVLISSAKIPVLRRSPSKLPHFIATFILVSFSMSMVLTLYIMVFVNMAVNLTTIDEITAKQARVYSRYKEKDARRSKSPSWCTGKVPRIEEGRRYINMSHQGSRVVVPFHVKDTPYTLGFKRNMVNTFLNGNVNDNFSSRPYSRKLFIKALVVCFVPFIDLIYSQRARQNHSSTYEDCADKFTPQFIAFLQRKITGGNFEHASYINNLNSLSPTEDSSA